MTEVIFFGTVVFLLFVGPLMTVCSVIYYINRWIKVKYRNRTNSVPEVVLSETIYENNDDQIGIYRV